MSIAEDEEQVMDEYVESLHARIRELEQAIVRWYEHDNSACDAELALLDIAEEIEERKYRQVAKGGEGK